MPITEAEVRAITGSPVFPDRRRARRWKAPDAGFVSVSLKDTRQFLGSATLVDASESGLAFFIGVAIRPGTMLHLRNSHVEYVGVVRNCQRTGDTYRVGLELVWS